MTDHVAEKTMDQETTIEELKAEQEALQEKAERKHLESFWWAAVIIWTGIVFIATNLDTRWSGHWQGVFSVGACGSSSPPQ